MLEDVFSPEAAAVFAVLATLYALWLLVRRKRYTTWGFVRGWLMVTAGVVLAFGIGAMTLGGYKSAPSMSSADRSMAPEIAERAPAKRARRSRTNTGSDDQIERSQAPEIMAPAEESAESAAPEPSDESFAESAPPPSDEPAAIAPHRSTRSGNLQPPAGANGGASQPGGFGGIAPDLSIIEEESAGESAPPPPPVAITPPAEPPVATRSRTGAVRPTPSAPAEPPTPFETVPVFFGTDRGQTEVERGGITSIGFNADRGRRLVLGEANVTVPTVVHQAGELERPWELTIVGITLYREEEDPKKHFTIADIRTMDEPEFLSAVNARLATSKTYEDHALVFIHGYNVSFDAALYRTAQIAYDLKFDSAPFLYSWPSNGSIGSYEHDQNNAEQAERYLREFVKIVLERTNARHVNFIAHSMGNKPLLKVLRELEVSAEVASDLKINQIILAAPDVDRDVFFDIVQEISPLGRGVTLYASANDRAMQASRAYAGGVPRAGDISELGPVLSDGLDTIDVSAASTAVLALNHSAYAEKSDLLADIGRLILEGVRPPRQRTPELEEKKLRQKIYWSFPLGSH